MNSSSGSGSGSFEAIQVSHSINQEQRSLFEQFCASLRTLLGETSLTPTSESPVKSKPYNPGFGNILLLHDRILTAVEKLFQYPTLLPCFQERNDSEILPSGSKNQEVVGMLEWIQDAILKDTPVSVVVQGCLISSIQKQVDRVGQQLLAKLMGEWRRMEELALLRAIYLVASSMAVLNSPTSRHFLLSFLHRELHCSIFLVCNVLQALRFFYWWKYSGLF